MPGFRKRNPNQTSWHLWVGDPDDKQAHQTILGWLQAASNYLLGPDDEFSNRTKGNLGEFITYCIGRHYVYPPEVEALTENASDPLSNMSRSGIDIKWLKVAETPDKDWVILQEVKTTGANSLSLADDLIKDYDKLFGQNLKLTLKTRLTQLKNQLDQQGRSELAPRITELSGASAEQSPRVNLVPTLLHDPSLDSSTKMTAVRQAIIGLGWPATTVECWSIQLDELDTRLSRISRGQ